MIVFKLERERPAYSANQNDSLLYVKDKYIRSCDFASMRDVPVLPLRSKAATGGGRIKALSYSAADRAVILCSVRGIIIVDE